MGAARPPLLGRRVRRVCLRPRTPLRSSWPPGHDGVGVRGTAGVRALVESTADARQNDGGARRDDRARAVWGGACATESEFATAVHAGRRHSFGATSRSLTALDARATDDRLAAVREAHPGLVATVVEPSDISRALHQSGTDETATRSMPGGPSPSPDLPQPGDRALLDLLNTADFPAAARAGNTSANA
jgi:hypothetical protein